MHRTEEILDNVIWLVNALDDEALTTVQDLPFLEMARVVAIAPSPAGSAPSSKALRERMRSRDSTIRAKVLTKTYNVTKKTDEVR